MAPSLSFALAARLTRGVAGMDSFVCAVCAACVCARAFVWWAGASQNYFVFFLGWGRVAATVACLHAPLGRGRKGDRQHCLCFYVFKGLLYASQRHHHHSPHHRRERPGATPARARCCGCSSTRGPLAVCGGKGALERGFDLFSHHTRLLQQPAATT